MPSSLAWAGTVHPPQRADGKKGCGRRTAENDQVATAQTETDYSLSIRKRKPQNLHFCAQLSSSLVMQLTISFAEKIYMCNYHITGCTCFWVLLVHDSVSHLHKTIPLIYWKYKHIIEVEFLQLYNVSLLSVWNCPLENKSRFDTH